MLRRATTATAFPFLSTTTATAASTALRANSFACMLRLPQSAAVALPSSSSSAIALAPFNFNAMRLASTSDSNNPGGPVSDDADTHPDFRPKPVTPEEMTEERESIMRDIRETIRDEPIVVFIKGLPECPVCSFSKKLIDILDALALEYTSFDVLAHPVVRSYVKEVSEWQTIPQLFIKGEFVGGVDVVAEMAKKGHLQMLLERHNIPHRPYQF